MSCSMYRKMGCPRLREFPISEQPIQWSKREVIRALEKWRRLFHLSSPVAYESGEQIFHEDTSPTDMFVIEHGLAKLARDLPDGGQGTLTLRFPGQLLNTPAFHVNTAYQFTATAVVDSSIHKIGMKQVREVVQEKPEAAALLIDLLANDLHATQASLIDQKTLTAPRLLERLVAQLASIMGLQRVGGLSHLLLPITDNELARVIGVSPEHFSRVKSCLIREGRLRTYNYHLEDRGLAQDLKRRPLGELPLRNVRQNEP